jgi:hypothetical protein
MAMGATATSPRWFCTHDGEYNSTPSREVLFSKRDAAASGPDGGRADILLLFIEMIEMCDPWIFFPNM